MSTYPACDAESEVDALFAAPSEEGSVLMAVAEYGFSSRYGWCIDRYGLSWQIGVARR